MKKKLPKAKLEILKQIKSFESKYGKDDKEMIRLKRIIEGLWKYDFKEKK
jgi:hypothetical protein